MVSRDVSLVVDRIRKLVQLAAAEGEEGRTAAWQACRLIREHGLSVGMITDDGALLIPNRAGDDSERVEHGEARGNAECFDAVAGLAGLCVICLASYFPGDRIAFVARVGVVHQKCRQRAVGEQSKNDERDKRRAQWRRKNG